VIPCLEALRDQQLTVLDELGFNAPLPAIPQLTPNVCVIRVADELEQQLAGSRLGSRWQINTGRVPGGLVVTHDSAPLSIVGQLGTEPTIPTK
jgi:hypothetical protein